MSQYQPHRHLSSTPQRSAAHPIKPLFLARWSPRAYHPIAMPKADFFTILEAARWAPSAFNIQPWRFVYALRDDRAWEIFVDLLDPFNAAWARHASALVFVLSDKLLPKHGASPSRPASTHEFASSLARSSCVARMPRPCAPSPFPCANPGAAMNKTTLSVRHGKRPVKN